MPRQNNIQREVARGEILRLLAECFPDWITERSLLNLLDFAGYPVLEDDLRFHLEYLRGKKLLELRVHDQGVGKPKVITAIRITTEGIDALDGRKSGSMGFR